MSKKKPLEIYVVLGEPPDSALAVKVWMEAKGDVYATNFADLLAGKHSHHQSGVSHSYSQITKRRFGGTKERVKLRGMKGFHSVTSFMTTPNSLPSIGYEPKPDSDTRRTLVAPRPDLGWCFNLWAIEVGRKDLAERIAATDPWPTVPVEASLLADWTDPWFLVTLSYWTTVKPYDVFHYEPALPGKPSYIVTPQSFEGTWLEHPGPKWHPGDAFPPEEWLWEAEEHWQREAREDFRNVIRRGGQGGHTVC